MKRLTINDIRSYNPCYDPSKYLPETFSGTVLDILNNAEIPFQDRLWVILRTDLVSEKLMRLFAVWCARQVQHLCPDERVAQCLDVMDAYIENARLIDDVDYFAAWEEERRAAYAAAYAASYAAYAANAADAAAHAACAAAEAASYAANAADAAADAACAAAYAAAYAAARAAQETKLREMLIAGTKTGDVL